MVPGYKTVSYSISNLPPPAYEMLKEEAEQGDGAGKMLLKYQDVLSLPALDSREWCFL
jgi:hypothetical protein